MLIEVMLTHALHPRRNEIWHCTQNITARIERTLRKGFGQKQLITNTYTNTYVSCILKKATSWLQEFCYTYRTVIKWTSQCQLQPCIIHTNYIKQSQQLVKKKKLLLPAAHRNILIQGTSMWNVNWVLKVAHLIKTSKLFIETRNLYSISCSEQVWVRSPFRTST